MSPYRFQTFDLGDGLAVDLGRLPEELSWSDGTFEQVWALHPETKPSIFLHGRTVTIPRWQQAYGADYHFSGQKSAAAPVPDVLQPLLDWCRTAIHPAFNGLLLNWYEGSAHYIGAHRDSVRNMVPGVPIVTISFGETRRFRLSKEKEKHDLMAENGTVIVISQETNAVWKHAVPKSTRYAGRRISVTVRGFERAQTV